MIKHVRQEEPYGCVIACCAMACGLTYAEAAKAFGASGRGFIWQCWTEFLMRRGFAVQMAFRHDILAKANRDPWPLQPWANMHFCSVDAGHGSGTHLIVVLRDGTALDPRRDQPCRFSEYSGVAYMAGVFEVGAAPRLPAA